MLHLYNSWIYWGYTDLVYDGLYVGSERHQRADHCQRPKQEEKDGGTKAPQPFQVDHQHCQYLKTECISVSMLVMVNLRNPNHTRRTGQNTIRQLRHVYTKISQPKCIDSILVCKDFCECLVWVRTLKLTYLVGQIWKKEVIYYNHCWLCCLLWPEVKEAYLCWSLQETSARRLATKRFVHLSLNITDHKSYPLNESHWKKYIIQNITFIS